MKSCPLKYEGQMGWHTACSDCDMETAQGNPFSVYMYCINLPVVQVNMGDRKGEGRKIHHGFRLRNDYQQNRCGRTGHGSDRSGHRPGADGGFRGSHEAYKPPEMRNPPIPTMCRMISNWYIRRIIPGPWGRTERRAAARDRWQRPILRS